MNRLVLIGNGFDLAHGLPTSYEHFINWYWDQRMYGFYQPDKPNSKVSEDILCKLEISSNEETWNTFAFRHNYFRANPEFNLEYVGKEVINKIRQDELNFHFTPNTLFKRIIEGVESRTWAGIEQDYYDLLKEYAFRDKKVNPKVPPIKELNRQLRYIQKLLVEYLKEAASKEVQIIPSISNAIYEPIHEEDIAIANKKYIQGHKEYWEHHPERDEELREIVKKYELDTTQCDGDVRCWREDQPNGTTIYPPEFLLPKNIMLLNFNYTNTAEGYYRTRNSFDEIHIHGNLNDNNSIIFGYGDELDEKFKELKEHKNNACLSHIKSICYLNAPEYRKVLSFIESEPFQVLIMGHSCGNSDRTLLNTIFEHPNCASIKPYYYEKEDGTDNYTELVQHISRNFNDMKLMRDRVVNKTQCEPLVNKNKTQ